MGDKCKNLFPPPSKKAGLVREYLEFSREQTPDSNRSTSSSPSRESIPRSSGYLYEPHAAREFASQSRCVCPADFSLVTSEL